MRTLAALVFGIFLAWGQASGQGLPAAAPYALSDPLNKGGNPAWAQTVYGTSGAMTIGQIYPVGRRFACSITVSGTVTVVFYDGSSGTYPLIGTASPPTINIYPFSVQKVTAITATGTCENWSS